MTDPTPATPDEERGTDPGFCPECDKHWSNHPDQHLPTPATPDEAVAALRGDLYLRLLDYYGSPGHAMDIADQVTAALGPGWSLSRQQGDTVAARVEEPTSTEDRSMTGPYECAAWPKCAHPCLREGEAIVSVEDVARRLADGKARIDGAMWHQWDEGTRDHYRAEASRLLGIGADGAGDGR